MPAESTAFADGLEGREESRVSQPFSEQAQEEGLPCMRLEGCRQSGI